MQNMDDIEEKHISIKITLGTLIKAILCVLLFYVLFLIKDLILVVFGAIVIASSIEPITKWLGRHKVRRLPAVIISYIILASVLFGIFFFFLPRVLSEALTYVNNLPQNISIDDLWNPIKESGFAHSFSLQEITLQIRTFISGTSESIIKSANLIFGGVLSFMLMIVLSFYFAVQEDGVGNFLRIITPIKNQKYIIDLWKRSQLKIGYWLQGQFLLGLLIGLFVYVGLVILGIKHALLLATLAAIFELIPVFGPLISAAPGILVAYVDGGITMGLLVAGFYLIIQQFERQLIYPLVVRKIVGISPILVILSLIIGAKLAGFLGMILSVPIASAIMEFVNDIEKRRRIINEVEL